MPRAKLRIGILDVVTRNPRPTLYGRIMHGNLASIMPQALGVWCERLGHEVHFVCYTGAEDLLTSFPEDMDVLFIGAFTQSAQLAYAVSAMFRRRGAVTVLGGPHARCYPDDARLYFDYVTGFTDLPLIEDLLAECSPHRPVGRLMSAASQPRHLPGVEERWRFVSETLAKTATNFKMVPMLGSLGCPYTCSFCIDATVRYQPMDFEEMERDVRFLLGKYKRPVVGWHDPNFGVRFDETLSVLERADPEGRVRHVCESSLSLLSEERVKRMAKAGFEAVLPGIESWYDMGAKSKTGAKRARDKMLQVSEHVRMIMRHIPYMQVNFVLGMDSEEGPEPFELTKEFLDRTPGAFPAYSLLSAFGEAAPMNLELQKADRVLRTPFHFLNNNLAMNVKPIHYEWPEFYDRVVDLTKHSFTWKAIARRAQATPGFTPKWMNVVRAISSEGFGRIKYHTMLRGLLDSDAELRAFHERKTEAIPSFYVNRIREDLGQFWEHLPAGAIEHDQNAYLNKARAPEAVT